MHKYFKASLILIFIIFLSCSLDPYYYCLITITNATTNAADIRISSVNSKKIDPGETQTFDAGVIYDDTTTDLINIESSYQMKKWQVHWDQTYNQQIDIKMECDGVTKTITASQKEEYYYEYKGASFEEVVFMDYNLER